MRRGAGGFRGAGLSAPAPPRESCEPHLRMNDPDSVQSGTAGPRRRFGLWQRVAWSDGPNRTEGEGVVVELVPRTPQDGQPRYRVRIFVDGSQTEAEIVLVDGVLYGVPRWSVEMSREERLRYHRGITPPWNEELGTP